MSFNHLYILSLLKFYVKIQSGLCLVMLAIDYFVIQIINIIKSEKISCFAH